jgi:hypothetical protein
MKKLELSQMENLQGGTNRQCLIDGALMAEDIVIGILVGGIFGAIGGALVGLHSANSDGCFS